MGDENPLTPTPYPDVNALLSELLEGERAVPGKKLFERLILQPLRQAPAPAAEIFD